MKYVITNNAITLFFNGRIETLSNDDERYSILKLALETDVFDYELEYIMDPKIVNDAKKLLLNSLKSLES